MESFITKTRKYNYSRNGNNRCIKNNLKKYKINFKTKKKITHNSNLLNKKKSIFYP